MAEKARFATAHLLRFPEIMMPDQLDLSGKPDGAMSWRIGPCGEVGPDGYRLPSEQWCAVGLYREREAAEGALRRVTGFMPYAGRLSESLHLALVPFRHRGECNHLDQEAPGELFDLADDPGGRLTVITTAGYVLGPELKKERLIAFRRNVDRVHNAFLQTDGCLASQIFTPHTYGDDGCTVSVWRDDEAMLNASYRAGTHKTHMDNHKDVAAFDRSSFTRFRILRSEGSWRGCDPLAGLG